MKILVECRRHLSSVGLNNQQFIALYGIIIPTIVIQAFCVALMALCSTLSIINCVKFYELGPEAMLDPFHIVATFVGIFLVYISLIWRRDNTAHLIDYLQTMVDERTNT